MIFNGNKVAREGRSSRVSFDAVVSSQGRSHRPWRCMSIHSSGFVCSVGAKKGRGSAARSVAVVWQRYRMVLPPTPPLEGVEPAEASAGGDGPPTQPGTPTSTRIFRAYTAAGIGSCRTGRSSPCSPVDPYRLRATLYWREGGAGAARRRRRGRTCHEQRTGAAAPGRATGYPCVR